MSENCEATIVFGDDHGDNDCTFHCKLPKNHPGDHREEGDLFGQKYVLTFESEPKEEPDETGNLD